MQVFFILLSFFFSRLLKYALRYLSPYIYFVTRTIRRFPFEKIVPKNIIGYLSGCFLFVTMSSLNSSKSSRPSLLRSYLNLEKFEKKYFF